MNISGVFPSPPLLYLQAKLLPLLGCASLPLSFRPGWGSTHSTVLSAWLSEQSWWTAPVSHPWSMLLSTGRQAQHTQLGVHGCGQSSSCVSQALLNIINFINGIKCALIYILKHPFPHWVTEETRLVESHPTWGSHLYLSLDHQLDYSSTLPEQTNNTQRITLSFTV